MIPGAQIERLEYGDICFEAVSGEIVGIEIKKVMDAVSCMFSGRLADAQIPGMLKMYDRSYLLIEGLYQADPEGVLQHYKGELGKWGRWLECICGRRRLTYRSFVNWLTTIESAGVILRQSHGESNTVEIVQALYSWWQKPEHHSYRVFNSSQDIAVLSRPNLLRRVAAELPLIGWERSEAVARKFWSVRAMANAPVSEWMEIDGIGKGIAAKVVAAVNNGDRT